MDFSRRKFLKSSGQLVLGFQLIPLFSCTGSAKSQPETYSGIPVRPHGDKELIDSWIRLDAAGHVTILTGKQELGQGIRTTLLQMAAEELDVPFEICHIINGDTGQTANEGYTAGSNSVEGSGKAIRQAAAEAKRYMLTLASQTWKEDVANLSVENGIIKNKSNKEISYWKLLEGKHIEGKITGNAIPKSHEEHRLVGKPIARDDIKNLVRGKAHFVHDIRLDGMVHARVLHPPSYGAKLRTYDFSEVSKLEGVLKVIRDGSFIAVIATREYQAVKAWMLMKAISEWETPKIKVSQDSLFEDMKAKSMSPETIENSPDFNSELENASKRVKQEYHRPYHMHASTGPSCAVAEWKSGNLTVWSPTQGVYPLQNSLSDLLGIGTEKIRCIGMPGSGCYGHNGADDVSAEAALIARSFPERPVRLQWMREDEHQWEPYGSAMVIQLEAGIDEEGKIIAWGTNLFSDTHSTRPNGNGGHYISARHLEKALEFRKGGFSGGSYRNAIPLYTIPSKRLLLHNYEGPLRTSALRGLGAYGNIFALESFMDELALAAEMDPIEFRLKNLNDARAKAVLQAVRQKTSWNSAQNAANKGFGVAFSKYKNSASYFAVVAEITVDKTSKTFKLEKLTGVIDSGQCINPDGLKNQTEGGMIQSASWTLLEKVDFDENGVLSTDWNSYPILRSKEVPVVEVHIINRPELAPMGAGEAAQGPVAAAIANAVFNGTGTRVRDLPISAEKVDWNKVN
ncbi:CO or xanthine dehydrogenase, Mo-binding subunit [Algoriphagus boritolerans DSM 17298 = JCM 18970]|uniref:CO or xanthine dehydrogenase, Mo-binding subunit n=2 Tax=Algoriphagus TaxID=246875 RepID=A0A1H5ZPT3_9BACT|nr:CO or xanthine dehydrogenase, Mo-binding subunit [Algoriphagus boritolerans DSM 17298 = JCM 18970]